MTLDPLDFAHAEIDRLTAKAEAYRNLALNMILWMRYSGYPTAARYKRRLDEIDGARIALDGTEADRPSSE